MNYPQGAYIAVANMEGPAPKLYGKETQALFANGFFNNPKVLEKVGPPNQYSEWIKTRRCKVTGDYGHFENPIVPAHIRTSDQAGTGHKNPYGEIPLLKEQHDLQHQKGYSAIGGLEKCLGWRKAMQNEWAKGVLKFELGGWQSFAQIPPAYFYKAWIVPNGVERYLPKEYRDAALCT